MPSNPAPLWLIVAVTASGTVAMHILVPALPAIAAGLLLTDSTAQLAITLYLVGLAIGQLLHGPLSDRFGRRPVLLAGLALYAGAGIVCALAESGPVLITARVVQALGGCSGLVLGRAIVRDTASAREAAGRLALVNTSMAMAPAIAPLIGGLVIAAAGWRAVFWLLAAIGTATLAAVARLLPETRPVEVDIVPARLASGTLRLARSRVFLGYTLSGACSTTSFYAFTAASPFIVARELHEPPQTLGIIYALLFLGIAAGGYAARLLARGRIPAHRLLLGINALGLLGAGLLLIAAATGTLTLVTIVGPMLLFMLAVGASSPLAATGAIGAVPGVIGVASGLYGFIQMGYGALCTLVVGLVGGPPTLVVACVLLASCLLGLSGLLLAGPRALR